MHICDSTEDSGAALDLPPHGQPTKEGLAAAVSQVISNTVDTLLRGIRIDMIILGQGVIYSVKQVQRRLDKLMAGKGYDRIQVMPAESTNAMDQARNRALAEFERIGSLGLYPGGPNYGR